MLVRDPVRAVFAVLLALLMVVLSWVVALVLGFFFAGVLAAAPTWLWFGVFSTLLLPRP